jgi:hypothetical protein
MKSFVLGLAILFGVAFGASPALARGTSKKLPDLVPTHAGIRGNDYAFVGKSFVTTVDRTKNEGKGDVSRRTHTDFFLVHGDKKYLLTDRFVPALKTRESHFASARTAHAVNLPIGAYTVEVCVDAKNQVHESNEHNNCRTLPVPAHFFVIPETWFGSISGIKTGAGDTAERWQSSDAAFDVDIKRGQGIFDYIFSGTVKWTESGSLGGGCVLSGTGTRSYTNDDSLGVLTIDYLHENYNATDFTDHGSQFFTITITCPHGVSTADGPSRPITFFNPTPDATPIPLPFGSTTLTGSPSQMANVTWTWDLKAGSLK